MSNQGFRANRNGDAWEKVLKSTLVSYGYKEYSAVPTLMLSATREAFFVCQYRSPFRDRYGDPMVIDFFLFHPWLLNTGAILEAKYQNTQGSVDRKLLFAVESLKATGMHSLLIVDGTGLRNSTLQFLRGQADDSFTPLLAYKDWLNWISERAFDSFSCT